MGDVFGHFSSSSLFVSPKGLFLLPPFSLNRIALFNPAGRLPSSPADFCAHVDERLLCLGKTVLEDGFSWTHLPYRAASHGMLPRRSWTVKVSCPQLRLTLLLACLALLRVLTPPLLAPEASTAIDRHVPGQFQVAAEKEMAPFRKEKLEKIEF